MRIGITAILIFLGPFSCFAQDESEQCRVCMDKAHTQAELNSCASDDSKRADSELNSVYHQLLSKAKSTPGATEKVEATERAWVQFRDAYIAAMFPAEDKQLSYGTMYPMEVDLDIASLTREQTVRIKNLINEGAQ